MKIKFGTDGWRAIVAKEYTVENVKRVTVGVALWLKENFENPSVVIGHDCRFGGPMFSDEAAEVLLEYGIKVYQAEGFISTPMIAMGVLTYKASLGIVITASHNPPEYNGYKLKGDFGGPLPPNQVLEVENLIPDELPVKSNTNQNNKVEIVDLEKDYIDKIRENFDLEAIANSNLNLAFDAMYGSGQRVIPAILPNVQLLHCEQNPGFHGIPPEPIEKNLGEFSNLIKNSDIDCGLVVDGDADRIGLFDSEGNFVDSHHIILILIYYLKHYKKMDGEVVTAFSSTVKIADLCRHFDLPLHIVKIGFKYTSALMLTNDVLVGGEESGGIAVKGHLPERDGIWMGLIIWEFMAKSGKSLRQIIDEIYAIVGSFSFKRIDLKLSENQKNEIIENCENGVYESFGKYKVERLDTLDGFKYILSPSRWLMIRPSGTEPVLRTYAEAETAEIAADILAECHKTILK